MSSRDAIRFSVLMPVYNEQEFVRGALDSVFRQTFTNYELIVIDDGSTDGSSELIKGYEPRLTLLQQSHQGPEVARNGGAAIAKGEYLVFLDADDLFFPFALATIDRVIRHFDDPPLVLATLLFFEKDGDLTIPPATPVEIFRYRNYLSRTRPLGSGTRAANLTDSIVVKKSVFDEVGGMRKSAPDSFHNEDSHLLLKLGNYGPCIVINNPATTAYRNHRVHNTQTVSTIAQGWLRIGGTERQQEYGGGSKWGRYALIGGRSAQWAYRYCWQGGHRKLALQLLFKNFWMIVVAVIDKFLRKFRGAEPPIVLD